MTVRSAGERLPLRPLAESRAIVEAVVDSGELPRFNRLCKRAGGVRARLAFASDGDGGILVEGTLRVPVRIDCHRCPESVPVDLRTQFAVAAATNEADAARLGAVGDVLELSSGEPTLAEVIEDELILALPQQPCARRDCEKVPPLAYPPNDVRPDNPFRSLGALKQEVE